MFSTHLGSANMALQSATPPLAPRRARNPVFGTRRPAPRSHRPQNLLAERQINRPVLFSPRQMFAPQSTMSKLADVNKSVCLFPGIAHYRLRENRCSVFSIFSSFLFFKAAEFKVILDMNDDKWQ